MRWIKRWIKYILIAAIALFLFANQGFRNLVRNYIELRHLRKQRLHLKQDNVSIEKELDLLNTQNDYIEKAARKELGLVKPGEIEYRFPPPKAQGK